MAARELLDATGKISAQFLPSGPAPINNYVETPMTENLDAASFDITNVDSLACASVAATGAVGCASVAATGQVGCASVAATGQVGCGSVATGPVGCTSITASGAVGCASVSATGAVGCASVSATGAVGCASVAATGTVSCAGVLNSLAAATDIAPGSIPSATLTGNGTNQSVYVNIPFLSGTQIPTVSGGVYAIQGVLSWDATAAAVSPLTLRVDKAGGGGTVDEDIWSGDAQEIRTGSTFNNYAVPFSHIFKAAGSAAALYVTCTSLLVGGQNATILLESLYITRIL